MKKFLMMLVLASMVLGLAAIAGAQAEDPLSGFSVMVSKNNEALTSNSNIFDLGSLTNWTISYTGAATISPMGSGTVTLTGNYEGGYIWSYAYSETGADGSWTYLAPLVQTFSASGGKSATNEATVSSSQDIYAKYVRIEHNATLSADSNSSAIASGTAAMSLSQVPEPGTVMAFGSLLASMGAMFLKKRS